MYNAHGKTAGGQKGRMQQAVEDWERSAKESLGASAQTGTIEREVENKIQANIRAISSVKTKEETAATVTAKLNKDEPKLETEPIAEFNEPEPEEEPKPEKEPEPKFNESEQVVNFSESEPEIETELKFSENEPEINEPTVVLESGIKIPVHNDDAKNETPVNVQSVQQNIETNEQAQEILSDQSSLLHSLTARFACCLICTLISVFLVAAPAMNIPLPSIISVGSSPAYFITINLILLIITGFLSFSVSFKGIASLFTLKNDSDSLTSLAFYAALIGGLYSLYNTMTNTTPTTLLYTACAEACISFNLFGKIFLIARVRNNFSFITKSDDEQDGYLTAQLVDEHAAHNVMRAFKGTPLIIRQEKAQYLTDFLDKSYVETPADCAAKIMSPISLALAVCAAGALYLLGSSISEALTVFIAVCCICAPLLFEAGAAVPFYRTCKRIVKHNALITGCDDVSQFGDADAVIIDSGFIFPGNCTRIYGVKTFFNHDIKEAMLYAASLADAGNSPLAPALLGIFADTGTGRKLLKKCEKVTYEDDRGLYAIIDGKVVLLGNRGILRHHMIEAPSHEYEMKNASNGRNIVYLAVNGVICAMLIVGYEADNKISTLLRKLKRTGVQVLLESTDPNVNPLLMEEKFGVRETNVTMLGAREMQVLGDNTGSESRQAGLSFKNFEGYVDTVISCIKLKGAMSASIMMQILFAITGAALILYAVFLGGGIGSITPLYILVFQAICAFPIFLFMLFRKN